VIGAGPAGEVLAGRAAAAGRDGACAAQIGKASASQIRRTRTAAQRSVLVLASSIVVAFLAAANAPNPFYERYETAWHASPLIGTIAFAAYAVAVIGLLCLKELPAPLGRRAVLLGAIAGQILALVLFAVAGSFALIAVGRVLQGLASGAALGTLSAAMVESDAERGTVASAASPGAGSGSGALLSGLLVQFLPDPRQTIYLILDSAHDFKARCAAWRRKQQTTSVRRCCPRSSWSPTSGSVYRRSSPAP
jgi:hypothetical protein